MNTKRTIGAGATGIAVSDIMIEAIALVGENSNIILPTLEAIRNYKDISGNNSQPIEYFFNNAGHGTITITANRGNLINGVSSITLSADGVSGFVTASSDNNWTCTFSPANSATTPTIPMGLASTYVILTPAALTITAPSQLVTGNVGQLGAPTPDALLFISGADFPAPASDAAVADAAALYATLVAKIGDAGTYLFPTGAVVLNTVDVGNGAGIFTAGVYSGNGAAGTSASGIVTLSGDGDFVFIFDGAITTGANTIFNLINGAKPSRVYFASSAALTTGAYTIAKGTFVTPAAITTGANSNIEGRLLSTVAAISTGAVNSIYLPLS